MNTNNISNGQRSNSLNNTKQLFGNGGNSSTVNQDSSLNQTINTSHFTTNQNFKVVVRCRPPLEREIHEGKFISTIQVSPDKKQICIYEYQNIEQAASGGPEKLQQYFENSGNYIPHQFAFDFVYDQDSTQEQVFETTAQQSVQSVLEGFNATIIAYGQTGTGKTYTMEGFTYDHKSDQRGIIPRSIDQIFHHISNQSNDHSTFMIRASYLQIYNENISDLLRTERQQLNIREDKKKGLFVEGLSEWAVRSPYEIYQLIKKGDQSRNTAATKLNISSSRSHAVFIIVVEQMTITDNVTNIKVGKLNLVDLAGSERARLTGAVGQRLEECKKINYSLSALGNVISALTDPKGLRAHIPYRDSKITRLLEDSLGGNCKTTMMAMVSPAVESFGESLSTLKFANRAKNIRNEAVVNEDLDQRALLRRYEQELQRLKEQLGEKNRDIVDKAKYFQLQEERERAEKDRDAVIAAYEERSKEFFLEREEKKILEEKIQQLYSQLIKGGRKIGEEIGSQRNIIEEERQKIREEYDQKMQEVEKERKNLEQSQLKVDRYKNLLLKQRDIMVALTQRLNERDEQITQLQEEIDVLDKIFKENEIKMEQKNVRIDELESLLKANGVPVPKEEKEKQLKSIRNSFADFTRQKSLQTYQDDPKIEEVYTVTEKNLELEQKMNELTQKNQKYETQINLLQSELQNIQNNMSQENSLFMSEIQQEFESRIHQLQLKYEDEIQILTSNSKQYEESQSQFLDIIQLKDLEIQKLQSIARNINIDQQKFNQVYQQNTQIKKTVDFIIETLSQPNDQDRLQKIAFDLMNLQDQIDESLKLIIQVCNTGENQSPRLRNENNSNNHKRNNSSNSKQPNSNPQNHNNLNVTINNSNLGNGTNHNSNTFNNGQQLSHIVRSFNNSASNINSNNISTNNSNHNTQNNSINNSASSNFQGTPVRLADQANNHLNGHRLNSLSSFNVSNNSNQKKQSLISQQVSENQIQKIDIYKQQISKNLQSKSLTQQELARQSKQQIETIISKLKSPNSKKPSN